MKRPVLLACLLCLLCAVAGCGGCNQKKTDPRAHLDDVEREAGPGRHIKTFEADLEFIAFARQYTAADVEKAANRWLQANPEVTIISTTPSSGGGRYSITIVYENK